MSYNWTSTRLPSFRYEYQRVFTLFWIKYSDQFLAASCHVFCRYTPAALRETWLESQPNQNLWLWQSLKCLQILPIAEVKMSAASSKSVLIVKPLIQINMLILECFTDFSKVILPISGSMQYYSASFKVLKKVNSTWHWMDGDMGAELGCGSLEETKYLWSKTMWNWTFFARVLHVLLCFTSTLFCFASHFLFWYTSFSFKFVSLCFVLLQICFFLLSFTSNLFCLVYLLFLNNINKIR